VAVEDEAEQDDCKPDLQALKMKSAGSLSTPAQTEGTFALDLRALRLN